MSASVARHGSSQSKVVGGWGAEPAPPGGSGWRENRQSVRVHRLRSHGCDTCARACATASAPGCSAPFLYCACLRLPVQRSGFSPPHTHYTAPHEMRRRRVESGRQPEAAALTATARCGKGAGTGEAVRWRTEQGKEEA